MTSYLFNNAKFRSHLINQLLDGKLKINTDVCNCIYKVNDANGRITSFQVNVDGQFRAQPCDYQTTLSNLGYSLKFLGKGSYGLAGKICQDKDCLLTYAIKVMAFDKDYKGDYNNPNRPEI